MTDSPSVMVTVVDRITPSAGIRPFTLSEHLSILSSTVAQEMYSDTDAAGVGSGAGAGSGSGAEGCSCSCCFFSSSSRFCSSRRLASSCFWRPPRPFWHHQPTSACQASYRPRSYPQSLPRPAYRQPWWCPFQLCRPSWCPWSAPALPWECCRGRTIRSFFRRRRRSAAGTAPAPTAKIGGFSSYLSFLIKAPYAEALSRPCVGCSVVTWKRASSGSAPQRLPPPGPRCPATAPSDCRPPYWQSPSCRCRPYRFRRSSTRRTPSHRRR